MTEGVFTGPEGVSEFSATRRSSFSNLDFATTSTEVVDNLVIVSFTMTGINTGSYHNLPASDDSVTTPCRHGIALPSFLLAGSQLGKDTL